MSILDRELKGRQSSHRHLRRILLIAGILLVIVILLFTFTDARNDVMLVTHFVTPPSHFTYKGHTNYISAITWSPDGKYIASASGDHTVQIWDANTGTTLRTYRGHNSEVLAVAWSPNGQYIASGSLDSTVQVWQATTGILLYTYKGHSDAVFSLTWSPDSTRIVSAGNDGTMQVWDASSGKSSFSYSTFSIRGTPAAWNSVVWSPDGKSIAIGGLGDVIVLDAATGKHINYYGFHGGIVHAVCWSPDSSYIAVGSADFTVLVWNIADKQNVYTYTGHTTDIFTVAWSPDGKRIASGSADGLVETWDALTGKHAYTYRGHSDFYPGHFISGSASAVNSVEWSPSGKRIASGSSDTTVQIWSDRP